MNNFNLPFLLKGLTGKKDDRGQLIVQTINNMSIVFLTCDEHFSINKFENPLVSMNSLKASNRNYGQLTLNNVSNKPMLIPSHLTVLNKEAAQNHSMVKGAIITERSRQTFNDAGCVEGGQAGHISERHVNKYRILPHQVKQYLIEKVGLTEGYDNVYESISKISNKIGVQKNKFEDADRRIDQYFEQFDRKLHEFVAHFEYVPKSIGFIVLVDNEIIGIDKFPSFEYAEDIFPTLVRDVYGSIALMQQIKGEHTTKLYTKTLQKGGRETNITFSEAIAKAKKALKKTKRNITDTVSSRISEIMNVDFLGAPDNDTNGVYTSTILKSSGSGISEVYVGQVLSEPNSNYHHMVTIAKKDTFNPENYREILKNSNKYKNLSNSQGNFSL